MSAQRFCERLRQQTEAIWQAIYDHPFVREVGAGTLARPAFAFFIQQDYLYLKDFARVLCLAAAKTDDLATLAMFTEHAATVVQVEHNLHSGVAARLGMPAAALEAATPAPCTQAYTRHLLTVGHSGSLAETVAAVLPCYWIYWEVGGRLNCSLPADPVYADWIRAYASPGFGAHVEQQLTLIDRLAGHASEQERRRMETYFEQSCRYEFYFWDQAYHQTTWSV
jgi:thiaminase (transcriptional activator TenA)